MNDTYEAACVILRGYPELGARCEGLTPGEIITVFAQTKRAEQLRNLVGVQDPAPGDRRDALGAISHEGLQPSRTSARHPLCRCTSTPEFCQCAGAQYDQTPPEQLDEMFRALNLRYGWGTW